MIRKITNRARDYAWGSKTLIPDYFGLAPTGEPMAEIWYGTHPGSPTFLSDEPETSVLEALEGHQLPYLLKILAADQPLSIQAHPNSAQAVEGFARDNAAGIALDAVNRNYKDDKHKPEMIVALVDGFEALCGFRGQDEAQSAFAEFGPLLAEFTELLSKPDGLKLAFTRAFEIKSGLSEITAELARRSPLAARLEALYPSDPGVIVAMLMNHVTLRAGEALYLPAGNIHAYLCGLGVEIMAASDNVLRGGLTPKHVDVGELLTVVDFRSLDVEVLKAQNILNGLARYHADCPDFSLYRVDLTGANILADLKLDRDSILLCTGGEVAVSDSLDERAVLRRGEAAIVTADAKFVSLTGSGTAFLAC
ncbi:MAG: hypothetical protein RL196_365 [Actinomycetota bacterium]